VAAVHGMAVYAAAQMVGLFAVMESQARLVDVINV